MKKFISFLVLIALCLSSFIVTANAESGSTIEPLTLTLDAKGFDYPQYLTDGKERSYADSEGSATSSISISSITPMDHLYIVFDKIPGDWTLTNSETSETFSAGTNMFLHEYINLKEILATDTKNLTLSFSGNVYVADIYAFSGDTLPDWVQTWEAPLEKADILLLSSHSDDEQLFFAGVLPYYAGERQVDVQVVYLISHFDTHERPHEQLNGLWAVGVKNYPIISDFPDLFSESLNDAISAFEKQGYTYDDFTSYIVENIRRFKPQVLVTHDIKGEYGHGTHIYCTDVVINSIESINDSNFCPESAEKYGIWDVPKTYLHLYESNPIVMDWDTPLEIFDEKTAFEMSVEGFSHHKSQHWTWFNDWIHGDVSSPVTKATDIDTYSPCLYGLYRTTVGTDTIGGDFLENIIPYKDQTPPETKPADTVASPIEKETINAELNDINEDDSKVNTTHSKILKTVVLIAIIIVLVIIIIFAYLIFTPPRKKKSRKQSR